MLTGSQINDIALKGRDFFALLQTIPGVVDTNSARETSCPTGVVTDGPRRLRSLGATSIGPPWAVVA